MGIKTVPHPSYCRDLAPCDFCLFPKLRGCHYETIRGDERGCDEGHWDAHTRGLPWSLPEVVETVEQVHCSGRRLLRRGLEFHMCTINKSAHTKRSGNLFNDPRMCCNFMLFDSTGISSAVTKVWAKLRQFLYQLDPDILKLASKFERNILKSPQKNGSVVFNQNCLKNNLQPILNMIVDVANSTWNHLIVCTQMNSGLSIYNVAYTLLITHTNTHTHIYIYIYSTMWVGCQSRWFLCLFWRETRQRILGPEISPYPEVVRGREWALTTRPGRGQLAAGQQRSELQRVGVEPRTGAVNTGLQRQ